MQKVLSAKWRERIVAFAPLFIWIAVIFFLSSPAASAVETSRFIGPLIAFLFPSAPADIVQTIHLFIRKAAHLTVYAILAIFALRAFTAAASDIIRKYRFLIAVLIVLAVASIDEINQSFEPSRTGAFTDVLLDLTGGSAMLAVLWIFTKRRSVATDKGRSPEG